MLFIVVRIDAKASGKSERTAFFRIYASRPDFLRLASVNKCRQLDVGPNLAGIMQGSGNGVHKTTWPGRIRSGNSFSCNIVFTQRRAYRIDARGEQKAGTFRRGTAQRTTIQHTKKEF